MAGTASWAQASHRWGYDDGSEAAHTFRAAINTNISLPAGVNAFLRTVVTNGGTGGGVAQQFKLQVSKNGGAYQDVTAASTVVKVVNTANLTHGNDTTQRVGVGTLVVDNNAQCDTGGTSTAADIVFGTETELVINLQVIGTDVAIGDVLTFKWVLAAGTDFSGYPGTMPTITVAAASVVPPGSSSGLIPMTLAG